MPAGDSNEPTASTFRSIGNGGGHTFWFDGNSSNDEAVNFRFRGESYPRMQIRPSTTSHQSLTTFVGSGSTPPRRSSSYINVRDFGAVGTYNGSSGPDDTAAIYAAFVAMVQDGCSDLYFPKTEGYYYSELEIPFFDGMRVLGDGPTRFLEGLGSRIWDPRTSGRTFSATGVDDDDRVRDIQLVGMNVDGVSSGTRQGFAIDRTSHVKIDNVYFESCKGGALYVRGGWDSLVDYCRFDECGLATGNAATTFLCLSDDNSNNWRFRGCTWETNGWDLFLGPQVSDNTNSKFSFTDLCKFETNYINDHDRIVINGGHQIYFDNGFHILGPRGGDWTTASRGVNVDGSGAGGTVRSVLFTNWTFEYQSAAATPSTRSGIQFKSTTGCGYDNVSSFVAAASGQTPTVAVVEWGTNTNLSRRGAIVNAYTRGATVVDEDGTPTTTMTRGT